MLCAHILDIIRTRAFVCVSVYLRACVRERVFCMCMYIFMMLACMHDLCMRVCMPCSKYVCMWAGHSFLIKEPYARGITLHIFMCMLVCMYAYMYACSYRVIIHIHTHIHTYTHTHTCMHP